MSRAFWIAMIILVAGFIVACVIVDNNHYTAGAAMGACFGFTTALVASKENHD